MISSITGLGFLIDDARWQMRPDIMVAGMITIAMIGWVMENWAFDWLERVTIELGEPSPADGDHAMNAELRRQ